ncbi:MAG: hypothetical protein KC668_25140, partial [Myxococcales bacterium]|nr:hypothetical protein [Myxococcales bacterium]
MSASDPHPTSWDAECLLEEARHETAQSTTPPAASVLVGRLPPELAQASASSWTVRVGGGLHRATVDAAVD